MTVNQTGKASEREMVWGILWHLSYNMFSDRGIQPYLRFDESLWNDLLRAAAQVGVNMVVMDLGDAVQYQSHPEIAVRDAWTVERLSRELTVMRDLGLEPIPKLNFSACHDAWLGEYARCVSTDTYYGVCRDLIAEVIELFDTPRLFHLGMDEETAHHQRYFEYLVVRQYDLWWHDLYFLVEQVEKGGVRPWIWSDYLWHHPEAFFAKMPKSVLQSNWYYGGVFDPGVFDPEIDYVRAYRDLEAHGYDQLPTGGYDQPHRHLPSGGGWTKPDNFPKTVEFCRSRIAPARLKGFLQTVWQPTLEARRQFHMEALEAVGRGKALLHEAKE